MFKLLLVIGTIYTIMLATIISVAKLTPEIFDDKPFPLTRWLIYMWKEDKSITRKVLIILFVILVFVPAVLANIFVIIIYGIDEAERFIYKHCKLK